MIIYVCNTGSEELLQRVALHSVSLGCSM